MKEKTLRGRTRLARGRSTWSRGRRKGEGREQQRQNWARHGSTTSHDEKKSIHCSHSHIGELNSTLFFASSYLQPKRIPRPRAAPLAG